MINRAIVAVILAVTATPLVAQQPTELASPKLRIEWDEFRKLYDAKKIEVLDVRSVDVYATGHIPGARSVPLDTVERRIDELKKLNKPLVFYCA
jgi:rhodanese-related sulfurtransferase